MKCVLLREGAYLKCTKHTRHSALRVGGQAASHGGDGAGCAFGIRHMKQTRKRFEPQYGEVILRAGGSENGYTGDGDVAYRKHTRHTHHRTRIRAPVSLLWGRLTRSARAVQLFGRLAVIETHTLRY